MSLMLAGCGANVNNASKPAADVMNATNRAGNAVGNATNRVGDAAGNAANRAGDVAGNAPAQARQAAGDKLHMATNISNQLVNQGYAKHVFTFVVGDNAYVAVDQGNQQDGKMGTTNKKHIEDAVKRIDNRVKNVYVSANPNTYARFQGYANQLNAGQPVAGIWNEFRAGIARMFPTTH